jgi:hypothetical protein
VGRCATNPVAGPTTASTKTASASAAPIIGAD